MPKRVSILGSTGSIGESTLDVIRHTGQGKFEVVALTAHKNYVKLAEQAIEFKAKIACIGDVKNVSALKELLKGHDIEVLAGPDGLTETASAEVDFTMAAIIGAAGLEPTLAAVDQGIHVGLANKECLVCAGDLFMKRVERAGTTLLPVDSEHNAIFQVLDETDPKGVTRLILTASGGPFRTKTMDELSKVSLEDALNHPVWDMGAKITIDSATLMNKGLELIEASYLFGRPSREIDILVHPQSVVHSMVEYVDGSVLSQMGSPDMRTPIAYALGWPDRLSAPVKRLDLTKFAGLTFFEPDMERFPALNLARDALETGGQAANVLNASNEVAVAEFLAGKIGYLDIAQIVTRTLEALAGHSEFQHAAENVDAVIAMDETSRETARELIKAL